MKLATLPGVVGTEVGIILVRLSPHSSWTRVPGAPQTVATGHRWPGARVLEF